MRMHSGRTTGVVPLFPRALLLIGATGALLALRPMPDGRFADRWVDPVKEPITVHWKDAQGGVMGNIGALEQEVTRTGKTLRFAMNGGMYDPQQVPVGFYVENGRTLHKLNTASTGTGNFTMQPNGVFGIEQDGTAFVRTTQAMKQAPTPRHATQSGPMLLVDGVVNAQFRQGSSNLHIRNAVGIRPDGGLLFTISREPVNFFDLATHLKEQGCTNALYFDGAVSRAYIPEEGLKQLDGVLGVMVALVQ
ncbi:MAG: phosphodiester glycosidase family protein [Flavobacteriales bacterium]|nr:phosphodiester glycosidase family protein [Flavobacteriales bacterium]MBK7941180.1 phosphodiester glycosidase family protein [Flavobacteriales bacterium]MBK9701207.1 phosphodiester glycosidase family protein [Flavobacteriales bacterium]